ncbi:MAG: energy transducer TonB [Hyphomonadaceae bacterium]|nr:energy transducer TonB [Hyphomonadaceae bacterium]
MYGAMRQRAPSSTQIAGQITGVVMTVLAMAGAGYALMDGIGGRLVAALTGEMTVATLPPPPPVEKQALDDFKDLSDGALPTPAPFPAPDDGFVYEPDRTLLTSDGSEGSEGSTGGGTIVFTPPPIKVGNPKLLAKDKPPYPATALRGHEEGTTGLELCINEKGAVTAASLVASSGHQRLDDAALKWVRGARFAPGTLDGKPQAMCGHRIAYEWRIEGTRN